jgi:hypothetical protein
MFFRPLVALAQITALVGCAPNPCFVTDVPVEDVPQVNIGCTLDELRDSLQGTGYWQYRSLRFGTSEARFRASIEKPLTHKFTVYRSEDVVLCVGAKVIDPPFTFVFVNDRLVRVHPTQRIFIDPENLPETANQLLRSKSMPTEEYVRFVKDKTEERNRFLAAHSEPPPVGAIMWLTSGRTHRELKEFEDLRAKYDGLNLTLGMSSPQVQELFGAPIVAQAVDTGERICVYGEGPVGRSRRNWFVAVKYVGDRCVAVYTKPHVPSQQRRAALEALGAEMW